MPLSFVGQQLAERGKRQNHDHLSMFETSSKWEGRLRDTLKKCGIDINDKRQVYTDRMKRWYTTKSNSIEMDQLIVLTTIDKFYAFTERNNSLDLVISFPLEGLNTIIVVVGNSSLFILRS